MRDTPRIRTGKSVYMELLRKSGQENENTKITGKDIDGMKKSNQTIAKSELNRDKYAKSLGYKSFADMEKDPKIKYARRNIQHDHDRPYSEGTFYKPFRD
jgi:hypothetical protein